jgi:hypothetical protein
MSLDPDHRYEVGFPAMRSGIRALPATRDAGRGITATLVIADEQDFHPYAKENYGALKPTIDAGGQLVAVSTANKMKQDSVFRDLYRLGKSGDTSFEAAFYGWRCRPGRDDAWYEAQRQEYSATPYLLEQEYPATEEEALAPAQAMAAFDLDALKAMGRDCLEPIERQGEINIYQKYAVGRRYMAGTDASHGVGQDGSVTVLMDAQTGYVVADIHSSRLSPEELAHWSVRLLEMFNKPLWGIEDNDWGVLVLRKAQELGYKNLFHREWIKNPSKNLNPGWHTDETTRWLLWGELIEAVQARQIIIPNKAGLGEFFTVIRNPDKGGKIEGMEGTHDDYPMATGIAWQMRKYVPATPRETPRQWRW